MGHRASMNGELLFDDMRLPRENMLGQEGAGFQTINAINAINAINTIYDTNGVGAGTMAVGVARAAYESALAYAEERKIWGQPIGKYQAIGNMLVDMEADLEMAGLMVRRIAWQSENNPSEGKLPPNMAKVYPAEMARRVTVNALHVLGGAGYMKNYRAEKYVRDDMVLPVISDANEVLKYFMSMKLLGCFS